MNLSLNLSKMYLATVHYFERYYNDASVIVQQIEQAQKVQFFGHRVQSVIELCQLYKVYCNPLYEEYRFNEDIDLSSNNSWLICLDEKNRIVGVLPCDGTKLPDVGSVKHCKKRYLITSDKFMWKKMFQVAEFPPVNECLLVLGDCIVSVRELCGVPMEICLDFLKRYGIVTDSEVVG